MSAIITEKFRKHNANQFHESFSEASASVYYLFIGRQLHLPVQQQLVVIVHHQHQQMQLEKHTSTHGTQC